MGSHQAPSTRLPRRVKVANTLMPMATSVQTFHVSRRHVVCRNAGGRGRKPAATGRCRRRVSRWVCRSGLFRKGLWHEYVCKLWKYCALRFHLSLLCGSRLRGLRFFFNGFIVCVSLLHLSEIGDGRDRHLQREVIWVGVLKSLLIFCGHDLVGNCTVHCGDISTRPCRSSHQAFTCWEFYSGLNHLGVCRLYGVWMSLQRQKS